ncbi:MAG: AMP-binding protein [Chitinophagales bacterium]
MNSPFFNIASLFFDTAEKFPDKTAITHGSNKITYGKLSHNISGYSNYLKEKGIGAGDRILVFIPMSIELYTVVLAIFSTGAVAVFLDEWVNKERMEQCCRVAKCKGIIAPWKIRILGLFSPELRKIPVKLGSRTSFADTNLSLVQTDENDAALITFTTGTTGTPKAANRTHAFLQAQYTALNTLLPQRSQIDMTLLPIVLLLNLAAGNTSIIPFLKSFKAKHFKPQRIFYQLLINKVESIIFSPYYLIELARYMSSNNLELPDLKHIISGGGPLFPGDVKLICNTFNSTDFLIVYGSTEAEPIAHFDAHYFLQRNDISLKEGLFVGKVDDHSMVKIIPVAEHIVTEINELSLNSVGEIIVSGDHVLTSYFNSDDAFRLNKIPDMGTIWHRTGDAGFINSSNELFLVGRCKQIIHFDDKVYYPFLIEQELKELSGVKFGTIVMKNNIPLVIIQKEPEADENKIIGLMEYTPFKSLKILFVKKIPMDKRHNTKIDHDLLLKEIAEK